MKSLLHEEAALCQFGAGVWEWPKFPWGGTHLEKGYGDVRPLRPPFHAVSAVP